MTRQKVDATWECGEDECGEKGIVHASNPDLAEYRAETGLNHHVATHHLETLVTENGQPNRAGQYIYRTDPQS